MSDTKFIELGDVGETEYVDVLVDGNVVFRLHIERTSLTSTNIDYVPEKPGRYKVQKFFNGRVWDLLTNNSQMVLSIDQEWS